MKKLCMMFVAACLAASYPAQAQEPHSPLRDRLVNELQMSPRQVAGLDAAFAEMQPRFEQLRELQGDERRVARRAALADLNRRVVALLSPAQRPRYEQIVREAAAGGSSALVRQLR